MEEKSEIYYLICDECGIVSESTDINKLIDQGEAHPHFVSIQGGKLDKGAKHH